MENFFEDLAEDDVILLESLIKSPVYSALKRALDRYRKECQSVLLTAENVHKLYQTQGRIIGINVIEQLPSLMVHRRQVKLKAEETKKQKEREMRSRRDGILNQPPPTKHSRNTHG